MHLVVSQAAAGSAGTLPPPTQEADMATKTAVARESQPRTHERDDNLIDTIHATQEAAVDAAKQLVDSVGEIAPELWEKPLASGAPAIAQIADAAFDLTRGILGAQRDFAKRLVDSVVGEARKLQ
jgi:hypothetical protein